MTTPRSLQCLSATSILQKIITQSESQYSRRERVFQPTHFQTEQLAHQPKEMVKALEDKEKQREQCEKSVENLRNLEKIEENGKKYRRYKKT